MTGWTIDFLLPDLADGGAQVVLINLANALADRGHSVSIVVANGTGPAGRTISPAVKKIDLRKLRILHAVPALIRHLIRSQPRVVISGTTYMNIVAAAIRAILPFAPFRLVLTEHTIVSARPDLGRGRILVRTLYRFADKVVGVSEGVRKDIATFARLAHNRTAAIFNPIVTPDFQSFLEEEPLSDLPAPKDHRIIMTCGRLHPVKDQETLIRAFARLAPSLKADLVILGDGPLRAELEQLAQALQISERVHFLGYVKNPLAYMKQADVFALSSRIEGLSNVLVEALYCGLRVISTDCPSGPGEVLKGGELGSLVPVGDVAALSDAMAKSLAEPIDRVPLKRRAEDFSVSCIADQYEALLSDLFGESGPAEPARQGTAFSS